MCAGLGSRGYHLLATFALPSTTHHKADKTPTWQLPLPYNDFSSSMTSLTPSSIAATLALSSRFSGRRGWPP